MPALAKPPEHPDATVSISSEVLREYREYERSMTTLVDAAVKPRVGRYISSLARNLAELPVARHDGSEPAGTRPPLHVMKSNGGVISAEEVVHQPITTVLSGPAAGALGAAYLASQAPAPTTSSSWTAAAPRPTWRSSLTASRP